MTLNRLLILIVAALVIRVSFPSKGRKWALAFVSILAIYWMQPSTPIRYLDFWLPTGTLVLTVGGWAVTARAVDWKESENWLAGSLLGLSVCLVAATRYVNFTGIFTPSRPPQFGIVLTGLVLVFTVVVLILKIPRRREGWLLGGAIAALIVLFFILKTPMLAQFLSSVLRGWSGQSLERASGLDIRWLGFSYVAFRLIHTLRDRQMGRLPDISLLEYLVYVIFFPAFTAGPIDRVGRFTEDLRQSTPLQAQSAAVAAQRLVIGLFKKFVMADALSIIALNQTNAIQISSSGWLWLVVYAYAFQIYFDFSGYTDIAIGLGGLLGIQLPENFNHPYLKTNLTQFWNNWHMTLTQWFRTYFFNPITRGLRRNHKYLNSGVIILITQISTMLLIGLWHGVTWSFVLWGIWHGLGLFVQNRFSEFARSRWPAPATPSVRERFLTGLNVFITFNYVALGWVWFALPTPHLSLQVFQKMFNFIGS